MRVGPTRRFWLAPPSCTGRGETDEPTCTPGSVAARRYRPGRWRPFILDRCCQQPHATYPLTRASSLQAPAVRSCSGRGLPSRDGHPPRWWALTPPSHPYPVSRRNCGGCFLLRYSTFADSFLLGSRMLCVARTFLFRLTASAADRPAAFKSTKIVILG